MPRQATAKPIEVPAPKSLEEAGELIRQVGEEQLEIRQIETSYRGRIERLNAQREDETRPYRERIGQQVTAVYAFAQANRDRLTEQGKIKTVKVSAGTFSWRLTPLSIRLVKSVTEVIAALQASKLTRFIHRKVLVEIDMRALADKPEVASEVDGVELRQTERFTITPAASGEAITRDTDWRRKENAKE